MSENGTAKKRHRSPNHPYLSLPDSITRANELLENDGMMEVPLPLAHERWGYKRNSSLGNRCVSALESYGLVELSGKGEARRVKVSERARRIIKNAPDRKELLAKAALGPDMHRELWDKYKEHGRLPSDDVLREFLLWEREDGTFNEDAVDSFIDRLRDTFRLAGIGSNDKISADDGESEAGETPEDETPPTVGDFVQWTSQGVDQFRQPRRVVGFSEDGGYAFVEGEKTGLRVSDLSVVETTGAETLTQTEPPENPFYREGVEQTKGQTRERTTLDEGPAELSMPEKMGPDSVQDFQRWVDDQKDRAYRRAGGRHKSVPLPHGGLLHLVSPPGSDKWRIRSWDFSWISNMHLMTATVHAEPNGWDLIEFDTPEDAVKFVSEKPIPSVVPQDRVESRS